MTDQTAPVPAPAAPAPSAIDALPERRARPDAALANSVPDDNHILMRMLKMLLAREGFIINTLVGVIILLYVIAKWGVPAILAIQTLILQVYSTTVEAEAADRQVAKQQVEATNAMRADLKVIGEAVTEQGTQIKQLSEDVAGLKADRKVEPEPPAQ